MPAFSLLSARFQRQAEGLPMSSLSLLYKNPKTTTMKAVYPVTLHNASLYEPLAKLFAKMGPNREHEIYIVSCPAALEHAQAFAESVKRLFRTVEIGTVANIVEKNPASRNAMFRDAVYLLEKAGNTSAWIWMEDAYPVSCDWLQTIQEEWNAKPLDRAYLGCIEKTFFRAVDEKTSKPIMEPKPLFKPESSPHMRFGVYPADFHRRSIILSSLSKIPFEIDMRDEIAPHCHQSRAIKTIWASKNFSRVSRGYAGEQSPEFESEIRKGEPTSINTESAAVLHGCRDGSILMTLLKQDWSDARPVRRHELSDAGRITELESEVKSLKAKLKLAELAARDVGPDERAKEHEEKVAAVERPICSAGISIDGEEIYKDGVRIGHIREMAGAPIIRSNEGDSGDLSSHGTPEIPASGWPSIEVPDSDAHEDVDASENVNTDGPVAAHDGTTILSDENGPRTEGQPIVEVPAESPAPPVKRGRGRPKKVAVA